MRKSIYRQIVWPFAIAQTVVWASLYYSFPALLLEFEVDLGWSRTELSGALTMALMTSALLAPFSGRLIDQGHGRALLSLSAAAGSILLIILSFVETKIQFYLVWTGLGACMSGALYEACFVFLTRHMGNDNKRAITHVALVAGLAGTVAFPTAHYLSATIGWRGTMLVYSAAVMFITVPLTLFSSRLAQINHVDHTIADARPHLPVTIILRSRTFLLLSATFVLAALNHGMLLTHFLPLMAERGIASGVAVFAASCIGPMQVIGRIVMMLAGDRLSSKATGIVCMSSLLLAAICLYWALDNIVLVALFVALQGSGWGVMSIVKPVITAEYLGRGNFGVVSGFMVVPFMAGFAIAPSLASLIWQIGGYDMVIIVAFGAAFSSLLALALAARSIRS